MPAGVPRDVLADVDALAAASEQFPPEAAGATLSAEPASSRAVDAVKAAFLPDAPSATADFLGSVNEDVAEKLVNGSMPTATLEQYRRLAATLHQMSLNTTLQVVMVASAVAGEGKSLTCANLALTLSESYRRRVLLIDADLRRPSIHRIFGLSNLDGLTDALKRGTERGICARPVSDTLSVVTAGQPDSEQIAHVTSIRMQTLLQEAREVYDWVILDTPPVALLSDAKLLGAMVDGALLLVRAGKTPYPIVQNAIQAIGRERILGTILNAADVSAVTAHSYYEGYAPQYTPPRRTWWGRVKESASPADEKGLPGPAVQS
jgi:capsular exopolysaccharide synthesis family protein